MYEQPPVYPLGECVPYVPGLSRVEGGHDGLALGEDGPGGQGGHQGLAVDPQDGSHTLNVALREEREGRNLVFEYVKL